PAPCGEEVLGGCDEGARNGPLIPADRAGRAFAEQHVRIVADDDRHAGRRIAKMDGVASGASRPQLAADQLWRACTTAARAKTDAVALVAVRGTGGIKDLAASIHSHRPLLPPVLVSILPAAAP